MIDPADAEASEILHALEGGEFYTIHCRNAADRYLYLAKHSGRNRVFSDYEAQRIAAS